MCVWTKKRGSMNCRLNVLHVVPINARTGNPIETETLYVSHSVFINVFRGSCAGPQPEWVET